jgi:hypothetical protein
VEIGRHIQGVIGVSRNSNIGTSLSRPAELLIALTAICKVSFPIVLLAILLFIGCFRNYTVLTTSPLYHSLYLSFIVPSTRSSCLNYAGSHLYSYLGNYRILLHIGRSYVHILYYILLTGGLGYRSQIWLVAEAFAEAFAEVAVEIAAEVLVEVAAKVLTEVLTEAAEVLIVQLNRGVGNLVYRYVVVQAGLGFNIDTSAAEAAAEALAEILAEVLAEVLASLVVYCLDSSVS